MNEKAREGAYDYVYVSRTQMIFYNCNLPRPLSPTQRFISLTCRSLSARSTLLLLSRHSKLGGGGSTVGGLEAGLSPPEPTTTTAGEPAPEVVANVAVAVAAAVAAASGIDCADEINDDDDDDVAAKIGARFPTDTGSARGSATVAFREPNSLFLTPLSFVLLMASVSSVALDEWALLCSRDDSPLALDFRRSVGVKLPPAARSACKDSSVTGCSSPRVCARET